MQTYTALSPRPMKLIRLLPSYATVPQYCLKTRLSNGDLLVKGKTWTGFANVEEAFADNFVGQKNPTLLD